MDLTIASLRALVALAEEAHFGHAADRLGVTQQGLSKRIARLEEQLGAAVVDRAEGRRLRLTPLGHEVLPFAREAVAANDRILARVPAASRRLRLDTIGDYLAPHGWALRAARAGGLAIDVVQRPAAATADRLVLSGEADFAFGRAGAVPRPWPGDLRSRLVLLEPLAVLVGSAHPWAARPSIEAAELRGAKLWFPMTAAPAEWRSYLSEFEEFSGAQIDTEGSTFGFQQWLTDVAQNRVPPSIIGEAMAPTQPGLAVVPIVDPTPAFPWSLFWRASDGDDRASELLEALGFPRPPATDLGGVWLPDSDRPFAGSRGDDAR